MSTAIAEEEIPANASNEEPASKKIRLEDEPSNVEDPNDNSLQDGSQNSNCTQNELNKVAPTQVRIPITNL